jgi:hypothetical protein
MQNAVLKHGDFVKVIALTGDLRQSGLACGNVWTVERLTDGALGLRTWRGVTLLVDSAGMLTDACDGVARVRGDGVATLPHGAGNGLS